MNALTKIRIAVPTPVLTLPDLTSVNVPKISTWLTQLKVVPTANRDQDVSKTLTDVSPKMFVLIFTFKCLHFHTQLLIVLPDSNRLLVVACKC